MHPLAGEPTEYRLPLSGLTGDDLVGGTRATAPAARAATVAGGGAADRARATHVGPGEPRRTSASARGGAVLCLPSVLASDAGEALDHRLPLMRSEDALAAAAARALRLLDDNSAQRVQATVALTRGFEFADGPQYPRTQADRASACVIAAEHELDRIGAAVRIGAGRAHRPSVLGGHRGDRLAVALEVLRDVAPRTASSCVSAAPARTPGR